MAESAPPGIDRWPAADETRPINDHGDHWRVGADQAQDALELGRPVQILSRPPTNPVRSRAVVAVGRYDTGVSDDLPRRWLEYQRTSREEMFDAWIQVDRAVREDPKEGWRLVLELVRLAAGDPVALGSIGAGPLEDLVRFHPNPFLDIAEAEARRNPPLADALRGTRYPGHGL